MDPHLYSNFIHSTLFIASSILFVGVSSSKSLLLRLPKQMISPVTVFFKCFPMIILINFVRTKRRKDGSDSGLTLLALCASVVGDAALVYAQEHPNMFLVGLIMFYFAHMFYIVSMGFKKFGRNTFFVFTFIFALFYTYLYQYKLGQESLFTRISCAFYGMAIFAMQWRAWTGVISPRMTGGGGRASLVAVGATFFAFSDAVLAVSRFGYPVPFGGFLIMTTYYIAQAFLALSVA